jgi:hypothetical protein
LALNVASSGVVVPGGVNSKSAVAPPPSTKLARSTVTLVLQLHVIVEPPRRQAVRTEQQQRAADAIAPDVDPALAVLEAAVGREKLGDLVPPPLVEVVAVIGLQRFDRHLVLEPLDPLAVGGEALFDRLGLRGHGDRKRQQGEDRAPHRVAPNGGTWTAGNGW